MFQRDHFNSISYNRDRSYLPGPIQDKVSPSLYIWVKAGELNLRYKKRFQKVFANLMASKQQIFKNEVLIRRLLIAVYYFELTKNYVYFICAEEIDKTTAFTTKHDCFIPLKEIYDTITNFIAIHLIKIYLQHILEQI